jgi:hypothetical protein
MPDWEALALTSHYDTAVAIKAALEAGEVADAMTGVEELIDALSRSDERAIKTHLVRLMQHVIKWKLQPDARSHSWVYIIREARAQVQELQEENPRFTATTLQTWWPRLLRSAVNEAGREMNRRISNPPTLTWEEVFEQPYEVEHDE